MKSGFNSSVRVMKRIEPWLGFGILFAVLTIISELSQWDFLSIVFPLFSIIFQVLSIDAIRFRVLGKKKFRHKSILCKVITDDLERGEEEDPHTQRKPLITSPINSDRRNSQQGAGRSISELEGGNNGQRSHETELKDATDFSCSTKSIFFSDHNHISDEFHAKIYPEKMDDSVSKSGESVPDAPDMDFSLRNKDSNFEDSLTGSIVTSPSSKRQKSFIVSPSSLIKNKTSSGWESFMGERLEVKVEASHTVQVEKKFAKDQRRLSLEERAAEDQRKRQEFESIIQDMTCHQLETPLARAVRILERMYEIYEYDEAARECINMVLDILADTDSLHSVVKSLDDLTVSKETRSWVTETLVNASGVSKSSAGRWGQLRNISKKIGLKQLIENNRRMRCRTVKFASFYERPEDFTIQPLATRLIREKAECTLREARRLGTQNLVKEEVEENDYFIVPAFLHPELSPEQHNRVQDFMKHHEFLDWNFDIFAFDEMVNGHSLWIVAMCLYGYHDHLTNFQIDPKVISALLTETERTYCYDVNSKNIYHNALHAADVTLNVGIFCENDNVSEILTSLQGFSLITAAIMHDYRHPGLNNAYLTRSADQIALTYNDISVLENMHASEAFRLISREEFYILKKMSLENKKNFRSYFIKTILATDLAHAFEFIDKFNATLHKEGGFKKDNTDSQLLLMQFSIKCADICHPAKPWALHSKWSDLITREFFKQGETEAKNNLPVSPLCNAEKVDIPKSQCNFIDFLVRPCFEPYSEFCANIEWMRNVDVNYQEWQRQGGENNLPKRNSFSRRTSSVQRRNSSLTKKRTSIIIKRRSISRKQSTLLRRLSMKSITSTGSVKK